MDITWSSHEPAGGSHSFVFLAFLPAAEAGVPESSSSPLIFFRPLPVPLGSLGVPIDCFLFRSFFCGGFGRPPIFLKYSSNKSEAPDLPFSLSFWRL